GCVPERDRQGDGRLAVGSCRSVFGCVRDSTRACGRAADARRRRQGPELGTRGTRVLRAYARARRLVSATDRAARVGSLRDDRSWFVELARGGSGAQGNGALMSGGAADGAADLRAQLQASLGASYVVEREIGGGGMARVFVAEEPGLGRKVVIKVLPPEMSEGISAERFAREIKLAASLQQANIVPVLAAGTAAGFPYYTMPFVEGRSLRDRC